MYGRQRDIPSHPGIPGQRRWICPVCGFVYDERAGDPDSGLPPGTPWEAVPTDWRCPRCRVTKSDFDPFLD